MFKAGPWINSESLNKESAQQILHQSLLHTDVCSDSRSVTWKEIFLFAACDGFGGVGGMRKGGTS